MTNIDFTPNKREQQQIISSKAKQSIALSADWLRDNGLNDKTLLRTSSKISVAKKAAHTLLTQHRSLLSNSQHHSLMDFSEAASNKRERARITDAFCHCVMNINTKINRKLFKQHRKLNQPPAITNNQPTNH